VKTECNAGFNVLTSESNWNRWISCTRMLPVILVHCLYGPLLQSRVCFLFLKDIGLY